MENGKFVWTHLSRKNNSNQFAVEEIDMIGGKLSDESREKKS